MKLFRFIFKDRSLWYKFTLLSIVPIILATIFIVLNIVNSLEKSMVEKTRIKAQGLAKLSALSMSNTFVIYNKDLLDNFVDSLGKEKNIVYAMIVDSSDGRILAHSDHQNDGKTFDDSMDNNALTINRSSSQVIATIKQGEIYGLSAPIIIGGEKYGVVRLGFSLKEVHQEIAVIKNKAITIAIIAIMIGALFSILLARIISKPVRALAEQASRIGAGNFEQRIIYKSKDALGQLADSINKMSEELKSNMNILQENEAKYHALFEASNDAVFIMDKEKFLECNDQTLKIFGCAREDIIGQSPIKFSPPTQPDGSLSQENAAKKIKAAFQGEHQRFYWQHIRLDGSTFDAEVSLNPTRIANKTVVQAVVQDISDRKRTEDKIKEYSENLEGMVEERTNGLEAAQEAMLNLVEDLNDSKDELEKKALELEEMNIKIQEATEAKSQFLANMSHELRTPLNAIIGFSEILGDKTFGELNAKQTRYINNVLVSGRHLLQLINDILDLSKVEAGKLELEPSRVNIKGLLENSLIMIKEKAMKHGVKLDLQISQELIDIEISADERKLKQIMFNLLSNAAKFTPDGGEIRVKADLIEEFRNSGIQELEKEGRIVSDQSTIINHQSSIQISVADSGIGIKPEDRERVFGEFEQVDSTYARQQEGTGLGLALTRRLVGLHDGRIWVESEGEGKGSTFTFVIPIETEKRKSKAATEPEEPLSSRPDIDDSRPLVLVVEDDRQASELIGHYLSEAGYGVAHAFDGEQAIQMALELRPYAITLDVILPKKDGWEVLAELKSLPEVKDIPVIIVSIIENRPFGLNLGAIEYFVKPVNKELLVEAVRNVTAKTEREPKAMTVLVVDDEPQTVELLTDMLRTEGFSVLQAYGGQQGIDLAIEKHPDLIILDLMMPEVSGFDVVEQLRAHPEAMKIPIMIYTSKDLTAGDRQQLNIHVQAIASKSASGKEDLLRELERLGRIRKGKG